MTRVNVGCGMSAIPGWVNLDNSFSVKLAKRPLLASLMFKLKLLNAAQMDYIQYCRKSTVRWADATNRIPLADDSAEVLYSSHMLEHLDRSRVPLFLREAKRVLTPGGLIRLAVPDIAQLVNAYLAHGDADKLIDSSLMSFGDVRGLRQWLELLIVGTRHHKWMYDGNSLSALLRTAGFANVVALKAGETRIKDTVGLDLYERSEESVYVEATKP